MDLLAASASDDKASSRSSDDAGGSKSSKHRSSIRGAGNQYRTISNKSDSRAKKVKKSKSVDRRMTASGLAIANKDKDTVSSGSHSHNKTKEKSVFKNFMAKFGPAASDDAKSDDQ